MDSVGVKMEGPSHCYPHPPVVLAHVEHLKGLIETVSPQANRQAQLIWNSDWQLHIDSLFPIDAATRNENLSIDLARLNKSLRNELFHWRKWGTEWEASKTNTLHTPWGVQIKFRSQDQMCKEEKFKKREYYRLLIWWFRTRRTLRDYSNPHFIAGEIALTREVDSSKVRKPPLYSVTLPPMPL